MSFTLLRQAGLFIHLADFIVHHNDAEAEAAGSTKFPEAGSGSNFEFCGSRKRMRKQF